MLLKTMVIGDSGGGDNGSRDRDEKEIAIKKFYKDYVNLDL